MHRFDVWAPRARKMAVNLNGEARLMHGPDERGWWRLDAEYAGPGTDYGYLIDEDKKPYPDPRSQWQPDGVHGLSRIYDQHQFNWTDERFQARPLASGIVYELHIGTFTQQGTLDAAIEKLDYLADLGITHVELMPVASYAGNHGWGYDGVALFAVHQPYGGPDALKRFVNAAHKRDLTVLLDVVYNHFGPLGNYTGKYGPYTVEAHHTPWGGAVNLEDSGASEVRRFFCDNALMWLRDFHIDGLRIDAVHAFVDRSAIHFLEQLAAE
jgi:maltooligosyltrehalose trehalohydrolase